MVERLNYLTSGQPPQCLCAEASASLFLWKLTRDYPEESWQRFPTPHLLSKDGSCFCVCSSIKKVSSCRVVCQVVIICRVSPVRDRTYFLQSSIRPMKNLMDWSGQQNTNVLIGLQKSPNLCYIAQRVIPIPMLKAQRNKKRKGSSVDRES